MMMIESSVDYIRSGGMKNVPVTKAVEHLYATTAKFSGCVILASRPVYSYPPRRGAQAHGPDIALLIFGDHHQQQQQHAVNKIGCPHIYSGRFENTNSFSRTKHDTFAVLLPKRVAVPFP
ncbi:hypothetical protein AVEN_223449-1 [Araneus ventricosus]|uniref:Uncharacterized protein n=1 Tax=Araneus ventricosus TaxID=182803 RepID=A0A4Y2EQY4_ARAVE|nr:hypothetical protein AVEN_223449-1 [Araneus ventricosus]